MTELNKIHCAQSAPVYDCVEVDAVVKELEAEIALRGKRMELLWKVLMLDESEQYHYEGYDELRSWFDNDGQINPREYSDD